jgi:Tfp pilus assembly protein PilN
MTTPETIRTLRTWASEASAKMSRMGKPAWRFINLSLGDEEISRKRALAVTIERGGLSIAIGQRSLSRIQITSLQHGPAEEGKYPTPENVADSLSLALTESGGLKAEICLGIPKAWSIFRVVELPISVREDLTDVISYELDRLTPFSRDEACYDFRILEENKGHLSIAVAAVKSDLIAPYLSALRAKGIPVDQVSLSLAGMATLMACAGRAEDALCLFIDEYGYEGALVRNGALETVFADRLEGGDEESILRTALQEVTPFIDSLPKKEGSARIVFHLGDKLQDRGRAILERLTPIPCMFLDDMDLNLALPGQDGRIPYQALGCALASLQPHAWAMNLLSKGRRPKPVRSGAVTAALGIAALCAWAIYMISPVWIEGRRLEEFDRQISLRKEEVAKVEAIRKEIDGVQKEIDAINNLKTGRPPVMDIMKELTVILPKNVWLARVRVAYPAVDIEGYTSGSASELLPILEASKYLQKVEFSFSTFRNARMNADRFAIRMEVENPSDETERDAQKDKK